MRKFLITVFFLAGITGVAKSASTPEQVKTLLIFNFIKFMEWEDKSPTINIAFLGDDEALFNSFKTMAAQRAVGGKKINLQRITNVETVSNFHLVYLSESSSKELSAIANVPNTVIVTEKAGLGKKGSYINLVNVEGKLRFEINKSQFDASNVKVSNQLLSLAILV